MVLLIRQLKKRWKRLIRKVRRIYKGPITYDANWDQYDKIEFWQDLDYVAISAYFPISDKKNPTVKNGIKGWQKHLSKLRVFYKSINRPILFGEVGYRSLTYGGKEPWLDKSEGQMNLKTQSNLYEALFKSAWSEPWFAGMFIWKWYYRQDYEDDSFSPQNKPALDVIKEYYAKGA